MQVNSGRIGAKPEIVLYTVGMRNWIASIAVLAAGGVVAGCADTSAVQVRVYPPSPQVGPFHVVSLPEGATLERRTWQIGSVNFTFQRGNHVVVRGGHLVETMPTGAPGLYELQDGALRLEVLGREYTGTWDGVRMVLNGKEAVYLGEAAVIYPELVLDYAEPETQETPDDLNEESIP